uniref:Uncharacterized protein n=1 Tax=Aegilops tauschii subsp. strangulata TaxID=200361 RepID=A0A453IVF8_AEGTS
TEDERRPGSGRQAEHQRRGGSSGRAEEMDWEGRAAFTSAWVLPVDHPLVRRVRPATTEARAAALRDLLVLWSSRGAETPRSRPPQPYAVAEAPFVDMQFRDVLVEVQDGMMTLSRCFFSLSNCLFYGSHASYLYW